MAIGGLVWGRLSDRMDIRALLVVGASGMVGSLLTMSSLQSLPAFYLAHVVYGGLGFSVLYAALLSTSAEWFPTHRGLITGLVTAGGAAGQGLLPFIASILIDAFGWRWAFVGLSCAILVTLALALPALRWPQGTSAPLIAESSSLESTRRPAVTVYLLAVAAFFCCMCMGVPVVHMASLIGAVCGSPNVGVDSLLTAMIAGAIGRVFFGSIADRIGPLKAYALASSIQTACVLAFPLLGDAPSFMLLSALFGFGFAGNMTCLSLCVRQAVPANRFGGSIGFVMMVAWVGMACGGYMGGVLFDRSLSYTLSFLLAGAAGLLNLAVLAALATMMAFAAAPAKLKSYRLHTDSHVT
jgi:MFS family permease